jgi:hypothetical protein
MILRLLPILFLFTALGCEAVQTVVEAFKTPEAKEAAEQALEGAGQVATGNYVGGGIIVVTSLAALIGIGAAALKKKKAADAAAKTSPKK